MKIKIQVLLLLTMVNISLAGNLSFSKEAQVNCYGYTAQEKETEIPIYNYRARFYNPKQGTFLSPDLVKEQFGAYSYVGGNPIGYFDPNGRERVNFLVGKGMISVTKSLIVGFGLSILNDQSGIRSEEVKRNKDNPKIVASYAGIYTAMMLSGFALDWAFDKFFFSSYSKQAVKNPCVNPGIGKVFTYHIGLSLAKSFSYLGVAYLGEKLLENQYGIPAQYSPAGAALIGGGSFVLGMLNVVSTKINPSFAINGYMNNMGYSFNGEGEWHTRCFRRIKFKSCLKCMSVIRDLQNGFCASSVEDPVPYKRYGSCCEIEVPECNSKLIETTTNIDFYGIRKHQYRRRTTFEEYSKKFTQYYKLNLLDYFVKNPASDSDETVLEIIRRN